MTDERRPPDAGEIPPRDPAVPAEPAAPAAPPGQPTPTHVDEAPPTHVDDAPRQDADVGEESLPDAGVPPDAADDGDDSDGDSDAGDAEVAIPVDPSAPAAPLTAGAVVRGTVVEALEDEVVIELAGGVRGRARKTDLADELGKIAASPGQQLELVVLQGGDDVRLRRRPSRRKQALARLSRKHDAREPVEGRVTSAIKGGYEVKLDGVRAFCPGSQLALRPGDPTEDVIGKTLPFLITKFDAGGRSLVVSRRKILEKEQKKAASDTKSRIADGARLHGRVVSFQAYGAFVDLGGVQGLLHVSEISHAHLERPEEALQLGQDVEVQVLRHEPGFKKVSLSMKALVADPWRDFVAGAQVGKVVRAQVVEVTDLGAFLEVAPDVRGLLPDAELRLGKSEDEVERVGTEMDVLVADIDSRRRRVGLVRAPAGAAVGDVLQPPEVAVGAKIHGLVERIAPFGVFVRLAPGRTGLLHASESATPPGADLEAAFPIGTRVEVEVLEISPDGDRIRLSRRSGADRAQPRMRVAESADESHDSEQRRPRRTERRPDDRDGGGGATRGQPRRFDERPAARGGGGGGDRRGGPPGAGGRGGSDRRPGGGGGGRGGGTPNPAAAPARGFASFGDVLRQQLQVLRGETDDEAGSDESESERADTAESVEPETDAAPAAPPDGDKSGKDEGARADAGETEA